MQNLNKNIMWNSDFFVVENLSNDIELFLGVLNHAFKQTQKGWKADKMYVQTEKFASV